LLALEADIAAQGEEGEGPGRASGIDAPGEDRAETDGEPQHPHANASSGDEVAHFVGDDQQVADQQHSGCGTKSGKDFGHAASWEGRFAFRRVSGKGEETSDQKVPGGA
jgi:hypothetical protein